MHSLPLFHRIGQKTVIVIGEGEAADAKRRLVERAGGVVTEDLEADAQLAFIAMDEPEPVIAVLKKRGVLVNVVDKPAYCDFTVPSLLERGAVLVAIGTGGVSAALAKALRIRLEGLLPQSLGTLARSLGAARTKMAARWPDAATRRRALDSALLHGGALDPIADHPEGAVEAWVEGVGTPSLGVAEFVLSSADPDDLTLRQARLLAGADWVFHDAGVAPAVLNRARADAVRQPIGDQAPEIPEGTNAVILRSR